MCDKTGKNRFDGQDEKSNIQASNEKTLVRFGVQNQIISGTLK
jgi:hypothetical protein